MVAAAVATVTTDRVRIASEETVITTGVAKEAAAATVALTETIAAETTAIRVALSRAMAAVAIILDAQTIEIISSNAAIGTVQKVDTTEEASCPRNFE